MLITLIWTGICYFSHRDLMLCWCLWEQPGRAGMEQHQGPAKQGSWMEKPRGTDIAEYGARANVGSGSCQSTGSLQNVRTGKDGRVQGDNAEVISIKTGIKISLFL